MRPTRGAPGFPAAYGCAGVRRARTPGGVRGAGPVLRAAGYAAFAFVAYMSTYSWPERRMTSDITESVTARRT